jgi:hypothetical protein
MPKDACYRKVKARYKVFPSAYASGAIAKCRKVGAKNWGNKSKKKPVKKAMGGAIMPSNEFRKRPVRRMLGGGEAIANGCGKVMTDRRKVTKLS